MNKAMVEAVRLRGGYTKLANEIGVTGPSVHEWTSGRRRVPARRCVEIERVTSCEVRRWDLRPGDWWLIWPELIDAAGAPRVPAATEAA